MPGVGFWHVKVAGLVFAGAALCCVEAAAETLEFALAQAYNNNPQLNSQRALVRAEVEVARRAAAGRTPTRWPGASSSAAARARRWTCWSSTCRRARATFN